MNAQMIALQRRQIQMVQPSFAYPCQFKGKWVHYHHRFWFANQTVRLMAKNSEQNDYEKSYNLTIAHKGNLVKRKTL